MARGKVKAPGRRHRRPTACAAPRCGAALFEGPPRLSANYKIPSRPLGKASDDPVNYKAETYDGYEPYDPKDRPGSLLGFFSVLFRCIRHVISSPKSSFGLAAYLWFNVKTSLRPSVGPRRAFHFICA